MAPVAIVENFAQGRYLDLEIVLFDRRAGPDPGEEIVLVDHALAGLGEDAENRERTAADPDRCPIAKQCRPVEIEAEASESDFAGSHQFRPRPLGVFKALKQRP